jgi:ABC-type multidrug transport system permease subunit
MMLSLNNFNQSIESRGLQQIYIKGSIVKSMVATFTYLMQQFLASIDQSFTSYQTQRLALFIVFIVLLFVVYFMFWLPLVLKMTRDIWRTRAMIIMIPLKVIQK